MATLSHQAAPVTILMVLLVFAGCGGGVPAPTTDPNEVIDLKRRVVEWQQRATVSEVEVSLLKQEIRELEAELKLAREKASSPAAPPNARDFVGEGTAIEEGIEPIRTGSTVEVSELEEPVEMRPTPPVPINTPAPVPADTVPADAPTTFTADAESIALYDRGYTLFHQKDYRQAEEVFQRYIQLYPQTELTDNAQFWIGECRYAEGNFIDALRAFTTTVDLYPNGNKVPDALLKAGKCLEAIQRTDEAHQTYREIVRQFPDSPAAAAAEERLAN